MNIIITGYYKKENLGDDIFDSYAQKLFSNKHKNIIKSIKILPIDKINLHENRAPVDRVILFGGETLNDYFLDKLIELWKFNKNIKFNAIGVSCNQNYSDVLNKIQIFESIGFRSKKDYDFFNTYVNSFYAPDIAFQLKPSHGLYFSQRIGLFLSQTAIHNLDKTKEHEYLSHIVKFIKHFISKNYKIYLFAMCTNEKQSEDDNIINKKVLDMLTEYEKRYITAYGSNKKVLTKFKKLKFAVCWRYHAHILSIIHKVPFVSISKTPKVVDLLKENDLNNLYCSEENIINKMEEVIKNKKQISTHFKTIYNKNNKQSEVYNNINIYFKNRSQNTFYIEPKNYQLMYDNIVNKFNKLKVDDDDWLNSQIVIFTLTKALHNEYIYGLHEKINKGIESLRGDIYWLINDCILHKNMFMYESMAELIDHKFNTTGKLNIKYINQNDYKGLHRSGWQYVVDSLEEYHNTDGMICDLYLDRTFHWNYTEYKKMGVIPYTKKWIGFIHHTTDEEYTTYNTVNLFKNKLFLTSLIHCKGLFVLSEHLKHEIEKIIIQKNIRVNIFVLTHPTEFVDEHNMFTMKKFTMNTNKKIIQIGAWMRVINAINKLDLGRNPLFLNKYVLRGKKMENYYFDDDDDENGDCYDNNNNISAEEYIKDSEMSDKSSPKARFSLGFITTIQNQIYSKKNSKSEIDTDTDSKSISRDNQVRKTKLNSDIKILSYLDNKEYDDLLTKNIVFINLVGASAVNTVIECVIRNTPIIVNKLPALVEILGDKYPLFYDDVKNVKNILNMKTIEEGYHHLKNLNKDKLHIEYFKKEFIKIIETIDK